MRVPARSLVLAIAITMVSSAALAQIEPPTPSADAGAGASEPAASPEPEPEAQADAQPEPEPEPEPAQEPEPWQGEEYQPPPSKDFGQGFYIMLGGATGIDMKAADVLSDFAGVPVDVSSTTGLNVRLGARQRHIGAEFQAEWLPAFKATGQGLNPVEWSMVSLSANLHIVILTGRVQPYLLIGGGYNFSKQKPIDLTFSGWSFRGGGGLDVFMTRNLALTMDVAYVIPTNELTDLNYLAIGWGLKYAF